MLSNLQPRNAVAVSFGRLNVRVALIVAGGSGIGEATAWMFAREGARVSIRDINYRAARSVADSIVAMLFRSSGKANIYASAKGAIISLTEALVGTYAKDNVRANVICSGRINTERIRQSH